MRKLMETLDHISDVEEEVVDVDTSDVEFDDFDASDKFHSEYVTTDWRKASEEVFAQVADELEQFGLKVYMAETGDDEFHWYIGK